ncbi:hypothetical protein C8R41DRAFT_475778 [Lentinula lateritia]|uniref:Uncharacterized protein n=1 Tax=Lentinula lateritia TaxID=40482 RepID=A0ABQ8V946_9AGAR|nr:hypothetical protein C8R41DRAFT_475778 [Lentinula lateritia]
MSSNSLHHYHRPHLPPIPDLRFEPSYLRSIQPYIHLRTLKHKSTKKEIPEAGVKQYDENKSEAVIEVEWRHVLWVTARDQILSPLFQGVLWALVGFYVTPYSTRVAHTIVQHLPLRRS